MDDSQSIPQGIEQGVQGAVQGAEYAAGGFGTLALLVLLLVMVGGRKGR